MKDEAPDNGEKMINFSLRVPSVLYEKLGKQAVKNRRSINNEIIIALEQHVDPRTMDTGELTDLLKQVLEANETKEARKIS